MRRFLPLSCLLLVGLFLGFPRDCAGQDQSPQDQITLTLPQAQGAHGEEVDVPITLAGAHDLGCLQMALLYDANLLEVQTVNKGPLLPEHGLLDHDKSIPGRLGLGFLSGPNADNTDLARIAGHGEVVHVRFKVLGKAGQKSALTPRRAQAWQVNNKKVALQTQDGEFMITGASFAWYYLLLAALGLFLLLLTAVWAWSRRSSTSEGERVAG